MPKNKNKIKEIVDKELNVIRGDNRPKTSGIVSTNMDNDELYRKSNPGPDVYGIKWPGAYKSYGSYGNPITDYGDTVSRVKVDIDKSDMGMIDSDIPDTNADLMSNDVNDEFKIDSLIENKPQAARLFGLFVEEITDGSLTKSDVYNVLGLLMKSLDAKSLPSYYKKRLMYQMIEDKLTDSK